MNISVFGLGYVGCISLGCFANLGHKVIGVDVQKSKVDLINNGKPTIIEPEIKNIIEQGVEKGLISATQDASEAVINSDLSLICVGTPSSENGHLNLDYVKNVVDNIGMEIKNKSNYHIIAIRSTVMPGTNEKIQSLLESKYNLTTSFDFDIVSNPEFLREGSAVKDFLNPPVTVIGTKNIKSFNIMSDLYSWTDSAVVLTDIRIAEMIKYVNNSFHALKVTFANEVGNICKKLGIDSHELMKVFCMDSQLNISPAYLKPGFAYGGSCLPKDLKGLTTIAHDHYIKSPVLNAVSESNQQQKDIAFNLICKKDLKNVGILGLSFKENTDDLRYSPSVELAEKLLGKGYNLKIYDNNVNLSNLTGTNKEFIHNHIPHLSRLIVTNLDELLTDIDLLIITQKNNELINKISIKSELQVLDLVKLAELDKNNVNYEGICW